MQSNYLDYFGMTLDPFSGDAGQLFCAVSGRAELLEQTLQMAEFAEMVPVITGPAKAGKSTLLRQLFDQLAVEHQVVMLPAKRFAEQPESIDNWLADAFNLEGYAHAGRALVGFINDQEQAPILLVDDAQALDEITIALLTKFRQNGLRLVFTRLDSKPLAKSVLPLYELALEPMDLQEATRYLGEYFRAAGVPEGVPLDNKTLHKLVAASDGWPGQLNALVRQHLVKQVGQPVASTKRIPWPHLAAGTAVLALVIVSFLWQFNQVEPPPTEVAINPQPIATPLVATPVVQVSSVLSVRERLQAAAAELEAAKAAPLATPVLEQVTVQASVLPTQAPVQSPTQAPTQAPENNTTTAVVAQATPIPAAYRLQFFGSWEQDSAEQFLQQQNTQISLYVEQTERDGKPWYVVLTEQGYADRQQALAAIEELPSGLKSLQPWARRQ
ncbi:AAA family ATPase [Salinibius halmophilus]|uniref:AAA family ATPase n=1 Tax=Salinibius halmophilus TaxID=1853216 RepID=UPI000E6757AC|nr:AAA family ATPase [Salinibius halmophilus]